MHKCRSVQISTAYIAYRGCQSQFLFCNPRTFERITYTLQLSRWVESIATNTSKRTWLLMPNVTSVQYIICIYVSASYTYVFSIKSTGWTGVMFKVCGWFTQCHYTQAEIMDSTTKVQFICHSSLGMSSRNTQKQTCMWSLCESSSFLKSLITHPFYLIGSNLS